MTKRTIIFLLFCIHVNNTYRIGGMYIIVSDFVFQKKVEEITVESLKKMLGMKAVSPFL